MMTSPFDFLNAINSTKQDIMVDDLTEKVYPAFMVNRGLSYFQDTILAANEMNVNGQLDARLQFDFLINIVRKRKRFSKWFKYKTTEDIEVIKTYYGYSNDKARQVLNLLTEEQLDVLRQKVSRGGRKRTRSKAD